jgi:KUP system potassium uptake protein
MLPAMRGDSGAGATPDRRNLVLAVGALGVVFGDIGTNPLFAMREAFVAKHHVELFEANVVGLLSVMFWSLIVVITVKYLSLVMRADNDGEGGILALSALATGTEKIARGRRWVYVLIGLFGAALLYGDGVITPAISVLAAVEGTTVAEPSLDAFVVPAAIVILVGLFTVQRKGTTAIGRVFGPIMIVWFVTIAVLGATNIAQEPVVFRAVWPGYAVEFFVDNGTTGFLVLGAVILVVVGGEALYADMGHFGRRPIMIGWYGLVLPSLVLVYFGQGALLIRDPSAIENPFYMMAPEWALYPLVVLATMATVIASQALISGAYSLTQQAVQLGYSPRVRIHHTSETHFGQIYIESINWLLMLACIGLVLGFRESAKLAAAYGVAVTTTMVLTTILFYVVARDHFHWRRVWLVPVCSILFVVDLAFFSATLFKIPEGGWVPLVMGVVIFTALSTWRSGRLLVQQRLMRGGLEIDQFIDGLAAAPPARVPGESAYLFATPFLTPPGLIANLRHNDSLHETVLLLAVVTEKRPRVPPARRCEIHDLGHGFHQIVLHYGFMQQPDVPRALADHCVHKVPMHLATISYFVGRESVRVTPRPGMARWREHLFALMSRNSGSAANYFGLPLAQTLELGLGVEL